MIASVCWAIISCSLVGMTQTDTLLSGVKMRGPLEAFAAASSLTPSHAILAHSAARSGAEFSPMPAFNLRGARAFAEAFPGLPQVACFDSSFHPSMPEVAQTYALPLDV